MIGHWKWFCCPVWKRDIDNIYTSPGHLFGKIGSIKIQNKHFYNMSPFAVYNIVDRLEQTEKHTLFGQMINLPKKRIVSILDQLLVYSIFVSDDLNLCLPPYQNLVWWMFFIIHNLLWNTLKLNTPTSGVLNQIKSLVWLDHRWDFSNYISPKHIASIKIIIQL